MANFAELWLAGLYFVSFGVAVAAFIWYEHAQGERTFLFARAARSEAESTALEALFAMRGLIHQLGNNAHELALQFDMVMNTKDEAQQAQVRERLRQSLHRFTQITHQVSEIDARLTGYKSSSAKTTEVPPHL
ncbi:MAG TPA: hypothetical protein VLA96_06915 [Terriglobales bacterium]|jgi:hypothetical protein|nr:hypothetical protein [Terriglobales bacterium]